MMVGRCRDRQLTVRLTAEELALFEAARMALHSRGALRRLPSQADTLVMMAAAVCRSASKAGALHWCIRCGQALAAWESDKTPGHLERLVGQAVWTNHFR